MIRSIRPLVLCTLFAAAACGGSGNDAGDTAAAADTGAAATAPAPTTDTMSVAPAPAAADSGFIDPNTASREQLLTVPHMTPALADSLVAGRPYADMRGVDRVLGGLSETQKDEVYAR